MTQQQTKPKKKPVKRVNVILARHHVHAGEPKKPGDKINVTVDQKERLFKQGIIDIGAN